MSNARKFVRTVLGAEFSVLYAYEMQSRMLRRAIQLSSEIVFQNSIFCVFGLSSMLIILSFCCARSILLSRVRKKTRKRYMPSCPIHDWTEAPIRCRGWKVIFWLRPVRKKRRRRERASEKKDRERREEKEERGRRKEMGRLAVSFFNRVTNRCLCLIILF